MPLDNPPTRDFLAMFTLLDRWAAGRLIHRAHPHDFGSVQLDSRSDTNARFSPISNGGQILPVLYGGENDQAAASETIFHTIDTSDSETRPRRVFVEKYLTWQWSAVETTRELILVRLDGSGLNSLGTNRQDLIEGASPTYALTRSWAEAIVDAVGQADGMWWMSRQESSRWAVVLFGTAPNRDGGVRPGDLIGHGPAVPFASSGLSRLHEIANDLDITVVPPT